MTSRVPPLLAARLRLFVCLALLGALAACGSHSGSQHAGGRHYTPSRYYPPPGPPSDPWGPYIKEASGRFNVPEQWIRSVMHQESGGQQDVISWAGAIGLMQVMPDTYSDLKDRYGLGDDPFDPHNNILAGTAYLREMYDRFGSPAFLAAYNAGPNRVDQYLTNGRPLPAETVHYVAAIAPHLGPGAPMSGPLAGYGGRGVEVASSGRYRGPRTSPARAPTPAACDPDAAYNPDAPCTPAAPPVQYAMAPSTPVVQAALPAPAPQRRAPRWTPSLIASAEAAPVRPPAPARTPMPQQRYAATPRQYAAAEPAGCGTGGRFDPAHPCWRMQNAAFSASRQPPQPHVTAFRHEPAVEHRPLQEGARRYAPVLAASGGGMTAATAQGQWGIQVGAFASLPNAQSAAEHARETLPDLLRMANVELPRTAPFGNQVAFQARLVGLPQHVAAEACSRLSRSGTPCLTVPPRRT